MGKQGGVDILGAVGPGTGQAQQLVDALVDFPTKLARVGSGAEGGQLGRDV